MKKYIFLLIPLFSILPRQIFANCARPTNYFITVENNTVAVAPLNFQKRTCPDASGMVRQNITTGETVKLADYCATAGKDGPFKYASETPSYLDECVPPGSYRYGFAKPFECCSTCCGTYSYGEAEVTAQLAADCRRTTANHEPVATTKVEWDSNSMICNYSKLNQPRDGGAPDLIAPIDTKTGPYDLANNLAPLDTAAQTNLVVTDAAPSKNLDAHSNVTTPDSSTTPSSNGSGCSMGSASGSLAAVGIHGFAFLVGVAWFRRRRVNR